MAYKDKDKQREANRLASKKYRDSMTGKGMTVIIPESDIRVIPKSDIRVIPCDTPDVIPKQDFPKTTRFPTHKSGDVFEKTAYVSPKRGKDNVTGVCCIDHAHNFTGQMTVMERLFYRPASQLGRGETNFVSLPGRACYGVV